MRRLLPLVLVVIFAGCGVPDAFTCTHDDQCTNGTETGRCEAAGACSFLDPSCAGGRRYAELSPGGLGGQCVDETLGGLDGGVDGPRGDAGPGGDGPRAPDGGVLVTNLPVTADTMLDSTATGANFGAATELQADGVHVILLRFDTSGLSAGTVTAVELHVFTTATGGLDRGAVQVFRLLEDWTEGTQNGEAGVASWKQRQTGTDWAGAGASGASRDPTVFGSATPGDDDREEIVTLSPSLVQGWLGAPATNHGVVLATTNQGTRKLVLVAREGVAGHAAFLRVTLVPALGAH